MPRLWTTHLSPLSGGGAVDGGPVCGLLRILRVDMADLEMLRVLLSHPWPDFHGRRDWAASA